MVAESLPHAFLFTGPRGTGKTSSARIVARVLNCTQLQKGEPCNECAACVAITTGSSPDLIEIDAASNRGIDEIRTLRDNIKLAPMNLKYKVYIIDEVHMLTTEAANALLKTLEEPPAHAVFILCTTDAQKLPDTVVSRCTQVTFATPSVEEIVERLEKIAKQEKITTEPQALTLIAQVGKGSFRDSVKIFEQIWASSGSAKLAGSQEVLGLIASTSPEQFILHLKSADQDAALTDVAELVKHGVNIRSFIERTIEELRQELLTTKGAQVLQLIDLLDTAYERTKTTAVPQLPLEMMIIQLSGSVSPKSIRQEAVLPTPSKPEAKLKEAKVEEKEEINTAPVKAGKYKTEDIVAKWSEVLKAVKPKNHSVEALLRSTTPVEFNGRDLILEVFYKFHKDKLETDKCRSIVEEAVGSMFDSTPVKLKLVLGKKPSLVKAEARGDDVSGANIEDEIVKAAAEIFKIDAV